MSIRRGSHVSCASSIFVLRDIIVCTVEVDLVFVSVAALNVTSNFLKLAHRVCAGEKIYYFFLLVGH